MFERVVERWRGLPRAGKWLVVAGIGMGGYFVVEPVLDARLLASSRADRAAETLEEYSRQSRRWKDAQQSIVLGATAFGEVALPGVRSGAVSAASNKIREALSDRGITEWNIQTQRGIKVSGGVLDELLEGEGDELQRVTFQVQLTDTPGVVAAVLAEIERMPEVTTIGRVEILRVAGEERKVQARLAPETWVIVRREERR